METKEKKTEETAESLDVHYAFILAAISTLLGGSEIQKLETFLIKDGFLKNFQVKKNLKLAKIAYKLWESRIWEIDKMRSVRCDSLHEVHETCKQILEKIDHDVVVFKSRIAQFMMDDDIIYENTLAEMIVIVSLLNLGVKVCNLMQSKLKDGTGIAGVFDRLNPQQIFTNVNRIYKYLPTPDDFDVDKSEEVHTAMNILMNNIGKCYQENFCCEE